jgi:hypothetical protein
MTVRLMGLLGAPTSLKETAYPVGFFIAVPLVLLAGLALISGRIG